MFLMKCRVLLSEASFLYLVLPFISDLNVLVLQIALTFVEFHECCFLLGFGFGKVNCDFSA